MYKVIGLREEESIKKDIETREGYVYTSSKRKLEEKGYEVPKVMYSPHNNIKLRVLQTESGREINMSLRELYETIMYMYEEGVEIEGIELKYKDKSCIRSIETLTYIIVRK